MAKNQQKNSAYWRERFEQMEDAQHNTSQKQIAMMQEQFDRTQAVISGKINAWYQRFAKNNGVSMVEAKRMLSAQELKELKWNVEDYIKYGKENKVSGAWMKQLENASARVHISRLEALKLEVQQEAEKLFGNYEDSVDSHIRNVYANDFYHTAFEIQKGVGVGSRLNALDNNVVSKIISKPWAVDGKNFSERIWESKTKLINNVHNSLTKMCITGESPDRAICEIANAMKVSKSQAGRLVMTESAAFANKAREDCMNELGVEEFEFCATLDSLTSEICREMDGKHYPMSEYVIGVTAPPMHPNCRSCTCPYFDDEFTVNEKRAARKEDGTTYYVPADTTYKEWKGAFVDDDDVEDFTPIQFNPWERNRSGERVIRKSKADVANDKLLDIKDASTLDELNEVASKQLGMEVSIRTGSVEYAKEQLAWYEKLSNKYHQSSKVMKIDTESMFGKNAAAETFVAPDGKTAIISLSGKNTKKSTLDRLQSFCVKVDDDHVNIADLTHEFAHTIASSKNGNEDFWKEIKSIKNRYNRALTKIDKENIVEKTLSYEEAIERKKQIFISEYANKTVDEFMAEGFSDALLSSNPSPYSKEVLEVVDKYFKKTLPEDTTVSMAIKSDSIIWPPKQTKIVNEQYKKAMSYAREKGIEMSGFKQFDGDYQTLIELIDDADSVAKLYPKIKIGKRKFTIMLDDTLDSKDFAVTRGHIVSINANAFRDTKMLAEEYAKLVEERWFVQGTDYHAIIKHELGHIVSNLYKVDGFEVAMKITGLGRKETLQYIKENLSEYAWEYKDGSEIISEVFADVYGNHKPSEFSLRFISECAKMIERK